jgi:amino acid adenylation domain-containing protein
MTVDELLQELHRRQVEVWVEGNLLRFRAHENALDQALITTLRRHKSKLIKKLQCQESLDNGDSQLEPLSVGQQALYFLYTVAPQSAAYNCASAGRIRSSVDVDAVKRAFQELISRHESFRTTFPMQDGQPQRRVCARGDLDFRQISANDWDETELREAVLREYKQPFQLADSPLLRVRLFSVSETDHVLLMVVHHIVFDAWSLWLVQDEFRSLYHQHAGGPTALLPALQAHYSDFAREQQELQRNERGRQLWEYWQNRLAGELTAPDLPLDHPRSDRSGRRGATHRFRVPRELATRLRDLAKAHGATPFMLLLAIFKVLLHRYTAQEDSLVGITTSGRTRPEFTRLVGYFVNTLAIRTNTCPESTFLQLLSQVKQRTLEAIEHQEFPFPLVVERLNPRRNSGRLPICSVMFGLQKPQQFGEVVRLFDENPGQINSGGLEVHPFELDQQEGQFDLTLEFMETTDSFLGILKYDLDLFNGTTAERMGRHFLALAEEIVASPNRQLADFDLMAADERQRVFDFASTGPSPALPVPYVHRLFELQAALTPDNIAVVCGTQKLTYDQLNRRANQVACMLQHQGVQPDMPIACRLERGLDVAIVLLAVLKAGGTYVPLDTAAPEYRLQQIVLDCGAKIVITNSGSKFSPSASPEGAPRSICIDEHRACLDLLPETNLKTSIAPTSLAYILYTSGSTGRPKGVCVSHVAFAQYIVTIRDVFGLVPSDRMLQFSNLTFDPSLHQMFAPWSVGAATVLRGDELWSPEQFWQVTRQQALTVVDVPPAYIKHCTEMLNSAPADLLSIRLIIVGGDLFPTEIIGAWSERNVRIINIYGPTEAVIAATVYEADRQDAAKSRIPIGRPIPGQRAYVLDGRQRPVPIGVPGELYLGGTMLAAGYANEPELTSSKFVADPFSASDGARMYRTGDRARWTVDGNLEFLGRRDWQIKINGFRVETSEIEKVLNTAPQVDQSVVQPHPDSRGETHLVAWVVGTNGHQPKPDELRAFLRTRLPRYMVPRQFVLLDRLPINAAGKIDTKVLSAPAVKRPANCDYSPPRNEAERILAEIWQKELEIASVGIHDNFFDLGGGSLSSLRIIARARQSGLEFDPEILRPESLFEYPTVSELVALLNSKANPKP